MKIDNIDEIVGKMNNFYVTLRKKYLLMNTKAEYMTIQDTKKKHIKLTDKQFEDHLKQKYTIGVFAGEVFTKFICFDVDVKNKDLAKWTVYKIVDTIINMGIPQDYIYISESGSKGYHVEIYFDKPVFNKIVKRFFLMVLNTTDLLNVDFGQVELRPTATQGVKIPLGINWKTKKVCWYCDYLHRLKPIEKYDYILAIKQLDSQFFYNLLNIDEDYDITTEQAEEFEEIKDKAKPLPIYQENINEDVTIEAIEKLINEGLMLEGTRHNSLLKIAKYNKYMGLDKQKNMNMLIEWMKKQDKKTYSTKWDDCILDIEKIIDWTYTHNASLIIRNKDIEVTGNEIQEIMKIKGKNDKLLLYCMLIHSKRYADKKNIFYMSYKQMQDVTGLTERSAKNLIKKLEQAELIQVIRDTHYIYSKKLKKPITNTNRYILKINLLGEKYGNKKIFKVCSKNCPNCLNVCLCKMFKNDELKKMLTKDYYYKLLKFKDTELNNYECNNSSI